MRKHKYVVIKEGNVARGKVHNVCSDDEAMLNCVGTALYGGKVKV